MEKRLLKFKTSVFRRRWFLELALLVLGGQRILAAYFNARVISLGIQYSDAMDVFTRIRSLEHWVKLWYRLGLRYETCARKSEKNNRVYSVASFWMMARAAFYVAQFPLYGHHQLKEKIYHRCMDAYQRGASLLYPLVKRVEIPFRYTTLPGYLHLSDGSSSERCIVIFGGIDGAKEEMHYYGNYFAHRGFSVLCFDAPGLGESWTRVKMDPDYACLGKAICEFLRGYTPACFTKVGLLGISLGGNMAIHTAAHESSVRSCVSISAPFRPKDYFHQLIFLVQEAAEHITGRRESIDPFIEKISLEGTVKKLRCPLLVIGGGQDTILPGSEALRIYEEARTDKKLIYYPKATHICPENAVEMLWEIEQWFHRTLQ